jgi:ADP-ribose pyrophosphatase YjhB (NUDIX family)
MGWFPSIFLDGNRGVTKTNPVYEGILNRTFMIEYRRVMKNQTEFKWMEWVTRLQAVAQNGLLFSENDYDRERYQAVQSITAEILAAGSGADLETVRHMLDHQTGYATPKVDVRGVVFEGDRILLVEEKADGGWTLPGGWADVHETPSEAVAREVWEESGFRVKPVKLLAAWDRTLHGHEPPHPFRIYKLFFLCALEGGEAKTSDETTDVGFFKEDAIPPLSMGRTTPSQIRRLFEHHRDPSMLTDFD